MQYRRACVAIDLLGLNRQGLKERRSWWLKYSVYPAILLSDKGNPDGDEHLTILQSAKAPYTNCTKCFIALWKSDRSRAIAMISEFDEQSASTLSDSRSITLSIRSLAVSG